MTDDKTLAILKIASIHAKNLQDALDDMTVSYPFTENFIINMSKNDLRILDTLTGRFAKLQDLIGSKIIDLYLNLVSEPTEGQTVLDKINKLEKLYVIDSADLWKDLRDIRNHISHEYPDNPQLTAKYLNNIFELAPKLIGIYAKLADAINS